jgi:hypothetical protein
MLEDTNTESLEKEARSVDCSYVLVVYLYTAQTEILSAHSVLFIPCVSLLEWKGTVLISV